MFNKFLPTAIFSALVLTACGGGGGSSPTANNTPTTGSLSIAITDAPVDGAQHVYVQFSGLTIKPASGDEIEFLFDEPKQIDLLALTGSDSEALINGETVEAGDYNWIRLMVDTEGSLDSYIVLSDGSENELNIPSGAETGLKLVSGFTVAQGSTHNFTIDFDLAKSIVKPASARQDYKLKPTLRLIDNQAVGTLSGIVSAELVAEACTDTTTTWGAVYLYEGADATPMPLYVVDDPDTEATEASNVFTSVELDSELDANGDYTYSIGFLASGAYTVAYTCNNLDDSVYDPDTPLDPAPVITFYDTSNVSISAGETSNANFDVAAP